MKPDYAGDVKRRRMSAEQGGASAPYGCGFFFFVRSAVCQTLQIGDRMDTPPNVVA
jgi:hypothetical protein